MENFNDIKELYQKVYPVGHRARPGVDAFLANPENVFKNKIVFGTYYNGKLVESVTMAKTAMKNVVISQGWISDKTFNDSKLKFSAVKEFQDYARKNQYRRIRVAPSRVFNNPVVSNGSKLGLTTDYKIIERILPGCLSRVNWINQKYFSNRPVDVEWWVIITN